MKKMPPENLIRICKPEVQIRKLRAMIGVSGGSRFKHEVGCPKQNTLHFAQWFNPCLKRRMSQSACTCRDGSPASMSARFSNVIFVGRRAWRF
jgi:hypothetical protein